MKISIITVCYNSEKYIKSAIESVLNQTYPDIEYIIIDGNSRDETVDIIKSYEPAFKDRLKWISEPDNGLYDAMNKGIRMASGEIIGLINSDDIICDTKAIEKIALKFNSDEQLDGVYSDIFYVSQQDTSSIVRNWIVGKQKPFRTGWHPAHLAFYVKKNIYDKYGLFNLNYVLAADFELMLRFIEKHKIKLDYIQEPFVKMRLGGCTNRSYKNIYAQNIECLKAFKENKISVNYFLYPIKRITQKLLQYKK